MTEAQWRQCDDPRELLQTLRDVGASSTRKAFLCMYACLRHYWRWLEGKPIAAALENMEQYVDGSGPGPWYPGEADNWGVVGMFVLYMAQDASQFYSGQLAARFENGVANTADADKLIATRADAMWLQCKIIRDLFRPFVYPVAMDAKWLSWNTATIPKLAQSIYDTRRFADLPILADALEEAGCTDEGILRHCRRPAEHVRGCWVLDLLLGKQ